MTAQPTLSAILTMHTEPDRFASLLTTLVEFDLPECELIIIHDRIGAGSGSQWPSLENLPERGNITVERMQQPSGRAAALNRGMALARGSLIWAPMQADRLNRTLMREVIRKVSAEPDAFWILDQPLPSDMEGWLRQMHSGRLPFDEQILLNRPAIPQEQLFFRKSLGQYSLAELVYRVHKRGNWQTTDSFFVIDREGRHRPPALVSQEFIFSMLRRTVEENERQLLLNALSTLDFSSPCKERGETLLQQVRELAEEDARRALEMINNHLSSQPNHLEAIKLKISLLEQLRRHVEAAELKHELARKQKRSETEPKHQTQANLFSLEISEPREDPTDDPKDRQLRPPTVTRQETETHLPDAKGADANEAESHLPWETPEEALDRQEKQQEQGQGQKEQQGQHLPEDEQSHPLPGQPEAFTGKPDLGEPELSELDLSKPDLAKPDLGEADTSQPHPAPYELSVIIPTTGQGRHLLEECLIRLDELCDPHTTELIVIDNASIDDTFDYLNQLTEAGFFNLRVITNIQNAGFARSVNQGMDAAQGTWHLVMHNDLLPEPGSIQEMIYILENNPHIGVIGPLIDHGDVEAQLASTVHETEEGYIKTELLDSCCMLFRASAGARFNEVYGLAFYESADVCRELAASGYNIAIATDATATHLYRQTTGAMGLHLDPGLRLENADIYHARWNLGPDLRFPEEGDITSRIRNIPLPPNIFNPPGYWLDQMEALFTSEVRTAILGSDFEEQDLFKLIRILLVADRRDFLRQIEERIVEADLPEDLLQDLIRYYFRHNIYSRCKLYLERPQASGPLFDLYRLRIRIDEKEMSGTVELLNQLMDAFPCHPELYWIAAELHHIAGNEEEAASFTMLADQLYPKRGRDVDAFEIKY